MNTKHLFSNNRMAKAMLGVTKEEFDSLLPTFASALKSLVRDRRPERKRAVGAGQKGSFKTAGEKLAFSLMYAKIYPTFDVMGFLTGTERTRSCRNAHFLLGVLEEALGRRLVLPERKIRSVEEFFEKFPEARDIFPDGTERPVQRPKDAKRRKKLYSGKKKRFTRKTIVVADERKRILVLTPTKSGRRHDKRLWDKSGLPKAIPDGVTAWTDTGFLGMEKDHSNTQMPKKASKNHPLTERDKQNNRIISGLRIVAEHAIGGMKRYKAAGRHLQKPHPEHRRQARPGECGPLELSSGTSDVNVKPSSSRRLSQI